MMKGIKYAVHVLIIGIVCFLGWKVVDQPTSLQAETNKASERKNVHVWTVYWDTDNIAYELREHQENIKSIAFFAAYFNEDGTLFIDRKSVG